MFRVGTGLAPPLDRPSSLVLSSRPFSAASPSVWGQEMTLLIGGLCLAGGLGLAYFGYRLLHRHGEAPKDFHGDAVSDPSGFRQFGGLLLLVLGLLLAMIFAPLFLVLG